LGRKPVLVASTAEEVVDTFEKRQSATFRKLRSPKLQPGERLKPGVVPASEYRRPGKEAFSGKRRRGMEGEEGRRFRFRFRFELKRFASAVSNFD